jgi:signal transduction histidine kinase
MIEKLVMDRRHRIAGLLLLGGVVFFLAGLAGALLLGEPRYKDLPWIAGALVYVLAATHVWRRRPRDRITWWFALTAAVFTATQFFDVFIFVNAAEGVDPRRLAWGSFAFQSLMIVGLVAFVHLLGLFPDGRPERGYEDRPLRALWWLLLLPPITFVTSPTIFLPAYLQIPDVANPYHVAGTEALGRAAATATSFAQGLFILGVVLLVLRYRRSVDDVRRRIRWLILPAILAAFAGIADLVAWTLYLEPHESPGVAAEIVLTALWISALIAVPVAIAIALTRPSLLDVDAVLRRSLTYGVLWTLIAGAYLGAAAGLGLAAGNRLPVGVAIVLTVVATLLFQPARRRLEATADRWVFGERLGRYEALHELGRTMESSFDTADLLPRLAATVRRGLRLDWVHVVVDGGTTNSELTAQAGAVPTEPRVATLIVPVVHDGETLGRIECGAPTGRGLGPDDEDLVREIARQAGLGLRTIHLTHALAENVADLQRRSVELAESRGRLVRAQEAERRRIERDLHDGVQQDVVALIGRVGLARRHLARDPAIAGPMLAEVQDELGRILSLLREISRGIHPTVLADRGLVEAVEAQAARSPVPVTVNADARLRGARFPEEVESAAYFIVSESLTNVLKHAEATSARVRLTRHDGDLRVEVSDDGRGFDPSADDAGGLRNLAERLEALGGRLTVTSAAGSGTIITGEITLDETELVHG